MVMMLIIIETSNFKSGSFHHTHQLRSNVHVSYPPVLSWNLFHNNESSFLPTSFTNTIPNKYNTIAIFDKYYMLADEISAYGAAMILHPSRRTAHIKKNWPKAVA